MGLTVRLLEWCVSVVNEHQFSFLVASLVTLALYFLNLRRKLRRKIDEINAKLADENRRQSASSTYGTVAGQVYDLYGGG